MIISSDTSPGWRSATKSRHRQHRLMPLLFVAVSVLLSKRSCCSAEAPINDICSEAIELPPDGSSVFGTTVDATENSLPWILCGNGLNRAFGVFYYLQGNGEVVYVSSCHPENDRGDWVAPSFQVTDEGCDANKRCLENSFSVDGAPMLCGVLKFESIEGVDYHISVQTPSWSAGAFVITAITFPQNLVNDGPLLPTDPPSLPTTQPVTEIIPIPDDLGYEIVTQIKPRDICSTSEFMLFGRSTWYTYDGTTLEIIYTGGTDTRRSPYCTELQGKLYFFADDAIEVGTALYAANLTDVELVKNWLPDFTSVARLNDKLYFRGNEFLWVSDGTEEGTRSLEDAQFGWRPYEFTLFQGKVFYTALDRNSGQRLLFALEEDDNTITANIITIPTVFEQVSHLQVYGDRLYFRGCRFLVYPSCRDGVNAIWSTNVDGSRIELTFEGKWYNIFPMMFVNDREFIVYVEDLIVEGSGKHTGWAKLGSDKKLFVFFDAEKEGPFDSSRVQYHNIYNGRVIFSLRTNDEWALWSTDGTNSTLLRDGINAASNVASRYNFVERQGLLYFPAEDTINDLKDLWVTNGTPEGTRQVFDGLPEELILFQGELFFYLHNEYFFRLSNRSVTVTPMVAPTPSPVESASPSPGPVINDTPSPSPVAMNPSSSQEPSLIPTIVDDPNNIIELLEAPADFCDDIVSSDSLICAEVNADEISNGALWYQFTGSGNFLAISASCVGASNSSINASIGLYEGDTCDNLTCISSIGMNIQSCPSATIIRLLRPLERAEDEKLASYHFESVLGATYSVFLPPALLDKETNIPLIRLQVQETTSEEQSFFPSVAPTAAHTVALSPIPSASPTGIDPPSSSCNKANQLWISTIILLSKFLVDLIP